MFRAIWRCASLSAAAFGGLISAQVLSFDSPRVYSAGYQGVAVADFNHDGKLDIAGIDAVANQVSILLGQGDGTFVPAGAYQLASTTRSIAVGDFDGDGNLDLAVANSSNNRNSNIAILLGNGDGTFRPPVPYPAGAGPVWVTAGDFNNDGKLDLAVADFNSNSVALLYGHGDGVFDLPVTFAVGPGPAALVAGDFNMDGKLDLAVANRGFGAAGSVSILLGTTVGGFKPAVNYPTGSVRGITLGDFNGDGKLDLALADYTYYSAGIMLGNGDGTFQPSVGYNVLGRPASLAAGDFNGDGKLDLVLDSGAVLLGNGDGTFQPAIRHYQPVGPTFIVAADFNNDGKQDLALSANGRPAGVIILLGSGRGAFQQPRNVSLANGVSIASADFNADGHPDLAVANGAGVSVLLGNGNGTFQAPVTYSAGTAPSWVAVGDFNGDGKLDLAVANKGQANAPASTVSVLLGNGDGTFQPARNSVAPTGANCLAVADFDGDGKLDLAVLNGGFSGQLLTILLGNGDGTFHTADDYFSGNQVYAVVTGDFNRDGRPDLAVAVNPEHIVVMLGNGDGTFQPAATYDTAGSFAYSLAIGDLNGDGILDIAVANGTILLGKGDGTFQPSVVVAGGEWNFIAVQDFNKDGKLDLAMVNSEDTVSVLLGDGHGAFAPPVNFVVADAPQSMTVADFNHDGRSDLAVAAHASVTVLTNTTH